MMSLTWPLSIKRYNSVTFRILIFTCAMINTSGKTQSQNITESSIEKAENVLRQLLPSIGC